MYQRCARPFAAALLLIGLALPLAAQSDEVMAAAGDPFGMGMFFGAVTLEGKVYNSIRLMPEFESGKFALAMDLDFRFTFQDNQFKVYEKDWYFPDGGTFSEYLNLYLTKFEYIRYGTAVDPLYIHLGALPGVNLGTGFIVGGYTNMNLRPERKLFGGEFIFDGSLVNFPYLGIDVFTSNVSQWDLFGTRIYVRPLAFASSGLINRLEVGFSGVWDTDAFIYANPSATDPNYWHINFDDGLSKYGPGSLLGDTAETVQVYGVDIIEPVLSGPVASLSLFGDFVIQNPSDPKTGGMVGLGGKLFTYLTYSAQIRMSGDDFQPVYFDRAYDLEKVERYEVYSGVRSKEGGTGYLGSLGFTMLQNGLVFHTSVEGPFTAPTGPASTNPLQYPFLKSSFTLAEGVLPYFDFQFW
ncbi:MAG: hypothetical protein KAJ98_14580, partial [Spirochaetaceae bacterium]|nr:hypothetical protein [Spirochaetaceae bacterium]